MAFDGTKWTIDRASKKIAYTGADHGVGGETYETVIDLHRWIGTLADDAVAIPASGDELDITNNDPSRRSTDNIITLINGYSLDEADVAALKASEHLYDGSIIQDGGDTIFDGIVNFGNADVLIQILQDGAVIADDWWNLTGNVGANADAAQGVSHRFMVQTRADGVDIDGRRLIGTTRRVITGGTAHKTFAEFKINGTSRGNNVLALVSSNDLNNTTSETTIAAYANITNTEGLNSIDVDASGTPEQYYSQWEDDSTPNRSQNDFYEYLKWVTRDGSGSTIHGINGEVFRGITHNFSFSGTGLNPVTNDLLVWGTEVVMTAVSRTFTIGEAVHEDTATPVWKGRVIAQDDTNNTVIIDVESGTVSDADTFTGQLSAETGTVSGAVTAVTGSGELLVLAIDDQGASGEIYVQVTKGSAPGNSYILHSDTDQTAFITTSSVSTERTVSTPFVGASTGSNIIGAYGIGFNIVDIDDSDVLTAFDGNTYSRPNLVTNAVGGLTFAGDVDRVLVAPWDGSTRDINLDPAVDKGQLLVSTILDGDDITAVVVKDGTETAIPADTPADGYIRVTDNDGFERRLHYSSWDTLTFTIDTTDGNEDFASVNADVNNEVYIAYLDVDASAGSHSYQGTYVSDRDLVALVRNGGSAPIKQFIAEWSFASTGQTLNAIRTTDL